MKTEPKRNQRTTGILFLCILVVRLIPAVYLYMVNHQGLIIAGDRDALFYLGGAQEILASGTNQFSFFPPLNFLFIAFFLYLAQGNVIAPMLALSVIGWITVIGIYLIARDLFSERAARIAAVVSGLYPNFIFFGFTFYAETLAIFFIVWSFFLLIHFSRRGTVATLIAAGVLWGLASLSRGGLNYFSLFIAGVISLNPVKAENRFSIKPAAIFLLAMVSTVTILSSVIPEQLGSTSLGSKSGIGSIIHGANRLIVCCTDYGNVRGDIFYSINKCEEAWPAGSQLDMMELIKLPAGQMCAKLFKFIAEDPYIYLKNSLIKLSNFWSPNQYVIHYIKIRFGPGNNPLANAVCFIIAALYVGVVCGGLLGVASSRDPLRPFFISFIVFYCLLIFVTVGNSKLRLPLMPFFIIYCAYCISCLVDGSLRAGLRHKWLMIIILMFLGNSIYKYREIRLSPAEIDVRRIELCNALGFPKTALYLIDQGKKFAYAKRFTYSAIEQERLNRAKAMAQKKLSESHAAK
jgi:4-amino-4-deoxy-L-arabinose transferase-like glycosyltransferase